MKIKLFLSISLAIMVLTSAVNAQNSFDAFWMKFKTAVKTADKTTVSKLSIFPLSMSYGISSIKQTSFLKRYNEIFNGEANAAKCFEKAKPEKIDAKNYEVYCPFKQTPDDWENTPIKYSFRLTKNGWKLRGLDNINE